TLRVGPGERFDRPSRAAAAARPGDTVLIASGRYVDCATWRTPDLHIVADGGPVEITGPVCGHKALFVTAAPRIEIVGITFRDAASFGGNGAGIRAEGGDLTIRRSRFEGNENGILAAPTPGATILVEDSAFLGNGALREGRDCAHGLYVNGLGALVIRRTRFEGTRVCHHVKSRASRTEITDSEILDTPESRTSYLVDLPNGGDLLLARSLLRKGPNTGNATTAVAIGFEGVRLPTRELRVIDNRFESLMLRPTSFVANRSDTPAELVGNRVRGVAVSLVGPGTVR
ncbi:right-handed parallel beta-helix repeat-containing protein, partial [Falsiroseomonas oryzae]|uniref:hypothetical protein n=1 Tax=Falsiroseomonas oryzae TaxID=2766473 RepID=UPI0022EACCDE